MSQRSKESNNNYTGQELQHAPGDNAQGASKAEQEAVPPSHHNNTHMQEHILHHFQSNYGIYSEGVAEATECWVGKTRERQIIM